jgi:hypothetical protein
MDNGEGKLPKGWGFEVTEENPKSLEEVEGVV